VNRTAKFGAFAERCHVLAKGFFFTQLPEDVTQACLQGMQALYSTLIDF
jgi:hypothetical protein